MPGPGWKKGQSGNPGGRPKQVMRLLKLARKHSKKALMYAVELLDEPELGTEVRDMLMQRKVKLEAVKLLTAYGMGTPPKVVEAEEESKAPRPEDELTVEELRALARRELAQERAANDEGTPH